MAIGNKVGHRCFFLQFLQFCLVSYSIVLIQTTQFKKLKVSMAFFSRLNRAFFQTASIKSGIRAHGLKCGPQGQFFLFILLIFPLKHQLCARHGTCAVHP